MASALKEDTKEEKLKNLVLAELECPNCKKCMTPPVHQCHIGHAICCACYKAIHKCPTCRNPLGESRAFKIENLLETLTFPCKYRNNGCKERWLAKEVKGHESSCPFEDMPDRSKKKTSGLWNIWKAF